MKKLLTLVLALVALANLTGLCVAQHQPHLETLPGLEPAQTFEPEGPPPPPGVFPNCCLDGLVIQYLGGVVDDFLGGNDPVTTSPELEAFLNGLSIPRRQFDEGGLNRYFGHSFQLRENCKVCTVRFEIKMRDEGSGLSENDALFIFGKTITAADQIWQAPTGSTGSGAPGTTILIATLPPASIAMLNEHIFTNAPGHWLNIVAQDDHAFDYIRLTILYY